MRNLDEHCNKSGNGALSKGGKKNQQEEVVTRCQAEKMRYQEEEQRMARTLYNGGQDNRSDRS